MSKLIFLDTEYSSVTHELAQLSYILDNNGKTVCKNFYFRINEMDEGAYQVNRLSKEWLDENGVTYDRVRSEVLADFSGSTLIAHNLNADKRVLENAFGPLPNAFGLCTMYRFAKVLKLPGGRPYKMPALRELMAHYGVTEGAVSARTFADFGIDSAHHDARWDAEAVRLCTLCAMQRGDCRNLIQENTNMNKLWKIEAHAHTAEVSLCAKMPAAQMVREVKAAGCDALIVTDHYTPEFFAQDLTAEAYAARVDDFFAGYRAAKEEGDKIGLAVFPALEVRISAGMEDYLVYGISPEELKPLGNLAHLSLAQLREKIHSTPDGLLVQAHPFRGYLNCQEACMLDGVEINNANPRHDSHNDRAYAFAKENGLLYTAGSDVHQLGDAGAAMMTCPPFADVNEFARLIRAGKTVSPVEE